ncbi:LLM class flavin-dependent oxidoreductase [Actinoplanes sp. RD1]|uniref:LLM class flavin-dependent oxidoreductase n=1 Tax=Actinoplanes sp. RD1 TaxID=3064538 RepID=UPI002741F738|nr:LLM class flavin-dependent oxidoreductase [Actinoplanes sp. RD1]
MTVTFIKADEPVPADARPSLVVHLIVAATDELAWDKAYRILADLQADAGDEPPPADPEARRLLDLAARGEHHDRALWTPIITATNAAEPPALVGSYATVAAALRDYAEAGCELIVLRGFDPVVDAFDHERFVLPLVRRSPVTP